MTGRVANCHASCQNPAIRLIAMQDPMFAFELFRAAQAVIE
jgi:hypothetical protein